MKLIILGLAAASTIAFSAPSVARAPAQSSHRRETNLEYRIDQGVRNGSLTRNEASRLRTRLANVRRLEWRYRRNGLSYWERRNLDRRFDALSRDLRVQRHDRQTRWHRR